MDYHALNQQLAQILSQFDLNQSLGGGSLAIYHQGNLVTALTHGSAQTDKATGAVTPWTPQTLSLNFSTGKGILVTLVHVLVSQGLLDYDTAIADYWPSFGQNGKQHITLRHVLSHEAKLFDITTITAHAKDMLDWAAMLVNVEQMGLSTPSLTSNTCDNDENDNWVAYSALVSGWVVGGLIERVTQQPLQQALEQYLLAPLGLVGQVYFGVPESVLPTVAAQMRQKEGANKPVLAEDTESTLAFYQSLPFYPDWQAIAKTAKPLTTQAVNSLYFNPSCIDINDYKSALVPVGSRQFNYYHPLSLQAKIPAANGVASSVALVTIYAMLSNQGEWQGKSVIQPQVFAELSRIHNKRIDKVMPAVMQWRLGYHRVFSLLHDTTTAFGHMGYNGSMAWCDPNRDLAVAFVHNYDVTMLGDIRQFILNETILNFFDSN